MYFILAIRLFFGWNFFFLWSGFGLSFLRHFSIELLVLVKEKINIKILWLDGSYLL
jgi:hypothetical protein